MRKPSEIVRTVRCAICGVQKQKSNNWWVVYNHVMPACISLRMMEPLELVEEDDNKYYLCGVGCANKLIGEYMTEEIVNHARESREAVKTESKESTVVRDSETRQDHPPSGCKPNSHV